MRTKYGPILVTFEGFYTFFATSSVPLGFLAPKELATFLVNLGQ
jgi:hypothetical protein